MYPIAYSAPYQGADRNRLAVLLRLLLVIPLVAIGFVYVLLSYVMAVIAWFTIVILGQYHVGFYKLNAGFIRFAGRINGYAYLLTDEYPSFGIRPDPGYPIQVLVEPAKAHYDRLKTFFRFILLIPVAVINYLMSLLLLVCGVLAWFAIVFTGELPESLYKPIRAACAWQVKALAYFLLVSEEFPPIWVEEEEEAPRFGGDAAALPADPYAATTAPDPYGLPGSE